MTEENDKNFKQDVQFLGSDSNAGHLKYDAGVLTTKCNVQFKTVYILQLNHIKYSYINIKLLYLFKK